MNSANDMIGIMNWALVLVEAAKKAGLALTIETTPLEPLSMGHYNQTVTVRRVVDRTIPESEREPGPHFLEIRS